jgi:glycosyltransferase involved in cell wall biosynthesis
MILYADYVICSTDRLAEEIYEHNKNVVVIPNAVEETDVRNERVKDEKYCFGYLGGMMHVRDVGLLEGLQKELTEKCSGYEFRLFGYNGTDVYKRYAEILSDYQRSKNFKLFEGLDIFHYYHFYNLMDCSLVPLENNSFNQYKSTLKMIEAGFFRKPVIVSNVAPYNDLINNKNCLSVNNKQDWFKYCKKLIDNPELGRELGENLYQSVKKYSLENVNKSRFNFYQDVHKKHNSDSSVRAGRLEVVN